MDKLIGISFTGVHLDSFSKHLTLTLASINDIVRSMPETLYRSFLLEFSVV